MIAKAKYWIDKLGLEPHPEGGFYKRTYESSAKIKSLDRPHSTAIYFLLLADKFSAFHRIKSDELWHFYTGSPLDVFMINEQGAMEEFRLGADADAGQVFQAVVPAGRWFASRMAQPDSYALVGCTVAPGFDFRDFEMANRYQLTTQFPQHATLIKGLTYPG
ncbi:MAG: cupin domain-containing protein [Tunicatimonas sp.]